MRFIDISQYVTNQATRLIVRAVGELDLHQSTNLTVQEIDIEDYPDSTTLYASTTRANDGIMLDIEDQKTDYKTYRPRIIGEEWIVTETDLCESATIFFLAISKVSRSKFLSWRDAEYLGP